MSSSQVSKELARDQLIGIDFSVTKIPDQQSMTKFAPMRWRNNEAPRGIQWSLGCKSPEQCAVRIKYINETVTRTGDVVVFDWMTRILPGPVVAFGIEHMVAIIRALNLGPTASTAKMAEQAMAIGGFFVACLILGTILFFIVRALRGRYAFILGLCLGALLAVPIILIHAHAGQGATFAIPAGWILLLLLGYGAVLGATFQRLFPQAMPVASLAEGATTEEAAVVRIDRRNFLIRFGGATAVVTVAGAVVGELSEARRQEAMLTAGGRWSSTHPLPNANDPVKPAPGTRREYTALEHHYRIDIDATPPVIEEQMWRLKISGLVEKPLALTLPEIRAHEPMHQFITLSCISNPVGGDLIGTTRWTGVSLQRLLPTWHLKPNATHLKVRSADDFYEIVALDAIRADERIMLAYAWDGVPLTRDHGFPLRIYIPDLHGMKQPKWITSIEVLDHWEEGYWVTRGWDKVARMKATAVIDTVATGMTIINADRRTLVPIGGIAHAGARGISKVELQVDNGPWQPAFLRNPLSGTTWVIWRFDWPFQSGKHNFTVRCLDGAGAPQIETQAPPAPSGASGYHTKSEML